MTAHQGIRVSSSTAGIPIPGIEELSGGYEWRKTPGWTGGNIPEARDEVQPSLTSGSAPGSSLREARIATFGEALRDLGYQNPRNASTAAVIEAGKRVGVGEKTARKYRAALLKQREAAS